MYQAIQQAPTWTRWDEKARKLSSQGNAIPQNEKISAQEIGQDVNGDMILKVNEVVYTKKKFFKVIVDAPAPPSGDDEIEFLTGHNAAGQVVAVFYKRAA